MPQWPIFRTGPNSKIYGQAFPVFIKNLDYHLSSLKIFADGAIDCWGLVDLDFFHRKIASKWIALQPPNSTRMRVSNFGSAQVANAEWLYSPKHIVHRVEQVLRSLNPSLTGLINFGGNDTEVRNGVKYTKMGLVDDTPYYINTDGIEIAGTTLPVFVIEQNVYRLTNWFIYADGQAQIGPDGDMIPIEQSIGYLQEGKLTTTVFDGARLYIEGLGHCHIQQGRWHVDPKEQVREVLDKLAILNGEPGAVKKCRAQFELYQRTPGAVQREQLRQAYEAVPVHLRMFCGDMDSKDSAIRYILYSNKDQE